MTEARSGKSGWSAGTSAEDRQHGQKDSDDEGRGQRQKKIDLCLIVILLGYGVCTLITHINGYAGLDYPYNTFLFRPGDRFGDFTSQIEVAHNPYGTIAPQWQQTPFFYLVLRGFSLVPNIVALGIFLAVSVTALSALMAFWMRVPSLLATVRNLLVVVVCSYPVLIMVDRANMEALTFIVLGLMLICISRERWGLSALLLAIAIALKPFAVFFVLLLCVRKRWLPALNCVCGSAALILVPLFFLPGDPAQNLANWRANLALYHTQYEVAHQGLYFGHSLFGAAKVFFLIGTNNDAMAQTAARVLPYYYPIALALASLVVWRLFRAPMALWKQAALATCCMNLLPLISADYRLLHFLSVFGLFVADTAPASRAEPGHLAEHTAQSQAQDTHPEKLSLLTMVYALLLGFLLAPRNIYHFLSSEVTSANILTPLAMLALATLILIETRRPRHIKAKIPEPVGAVG
jgi:hypothetical protein